MERVLAQKTTQLQGVVLAQQQQFILQIAIVELAQVQKIILQPEAVHVQQLQSIHQIVIVALALDQKIILLLGPALVVQVHQIVIMECVMEQRHILQQEIAFVDIQEERVFILQEPQHIIL